VGQGERGGAVPLLCLPCPATHAGDALGTRAAAVGRLASGQRGGSRSGRSARPRSRGARGVAHGGARAEAAVHGIPAMGKQGGREAGRRDAQGGSAASGRVAMASRLAGIKGGKGRGA